MKKILASLAMYLGFGKPEQPVSIADLIKQAQGTPLADQVAMTISAGNRELRRNTEVLPHKEGVLVKTHMSTFVGVESLLAGYKHSAPSRVGGGQVVMVVAQ